MKFEQFKTLVESLEKVRDRSHSIYQLGLDLLDYEEEYQKIISILLSNVFNDDGKDWIDWYLYERISFDGKVLEAWDENNNPICYDTESLWNTIKPYIKQ